MYDRILVVGKAAVVLKSVDIAVNSQYINLVPNEDKRKQLVEKGTYFLHLTELFAAEPAWQLLKACNQEELVSMETGTL